MKKKWVENRRKSFYSEIWGNVVGVLREDGGGLVKFLWDSPCVHNATCDGPVETVQYIWVNI